MEILEIAKGDVSKLNEVIERITEGKFHSMDGMNLQQLIAVKKIIQRANESKKTTD
jgi:hypothetical protein